MRQSPLNESVVFDRYRKERHTNVGEGVIRARIRVVRNGGREGPERRRATELGGDDSVGIYLLRWFEGEYFLRLWEAWRGREWFQRRDMGAEVREEKRSDRGSNPDSLNLARVRWPAQPVSGGITNSNRRVSTFRSRDLL